MRYDKGETGKAKPSVFFPFFLFPFILIILLILSKNHYSVNANVERTMHPALIKLLKLRCRSFGRKIVRGAKTPRGAVLLGLGVLMIVMWLGPALVMAVMGVQPRSNPETVRSILPLVLMGFCLLQVVSGSHEKMVNFSPAEVDFLFSGPFTRRELLVYKLSTSTGGALFFALMFSVVMLPHSTFWIAALLGYFLTAGFIQLSSMSLVMIGQTVSQQAYTRARKAFLLVVVLLLAAGAWQASSAAAEHGPLQQIKQFGETPVGLCLLAPFQLYSHTITAEALFPDLLLWATAAASLNLALLALVMWLDVNYLESAAAISQKLYARIQRVRRGGLGWAATPSAARWHLPVLPWLRGAGPIAWRQLMHAMRNTRGLLFFLIILTAVTCPMLLVRQKGPGIPPGFLAGNLFFLTIILTRMLPFDFRGDLDHLDWLKSLPIGSTAVASGQLVTPVLLMTSIHWLLLGGMAALIDGSPTILLAMALFCPPLNWLLFGSENLIFLLFPARMVSATPGDLQFFGRAMLELFAKMCSLLVFCGIAAAVAALAFAISGGSWIVALAVAWLVLAGLAVGIVPCVAWAYRRFDVSLDTPA